MKRILIIDDEIDLCLLIQSYLSKKNYEVYTAYSLAEGFKKLETVLPNVLLLDNNLPDGMGWQEAADIHRKFPSVNITLISAFDTPKDIKKLLNSEINVLEKPISMNDIDAYL